MPKVALKKAPKKDFPKGQKMLRLKAEASGARNWLSANIGQISPCLLPIYLLLVQGGNILWES